MAVADPSEPPEQDKASRGGRLAGFIYGTIVVLSVIVAAGQAFPHQPGRIAGLVIATTFVFWLAHVYAHALGHAVAQDVHLSLDDVRRIAYRERSIVEAGVPSIVALLAGAFGLISDTVAVWSAVGLGIGVLAIQGLWFARAERLSRLGTLTVIAANIGLGVALVTLKLGVSHY